MRLVAACAFGLEALVKRELLALGYEPTVVSPGRIAFDGAWEAVCRTNIHLRTADRVLIEAARFPAADFDALFETTAAFDWSRFIPADASFPVTGRSRKSQLTSVPAVQRAVKRAVVESLKNFHNVQTLPETGPKYGLDVALLNDEATLTIDTTGASLHKRGYRRLVGEAPIKETLAAALVMLSVWTKDRPLIDPFCGSGTIVTEAALIGLNIAPGVNREFASTSWSQIGSQLWLDAKSEARAGELTDIELDIAGFDADPEVLKLARRHAEAAGVEKHIHFQQRPFAELRSKKEYGCVITNPPYGDRLSERKALRPLYESMPAVLQRLPTWSHFVITSIIGFERTVGRKATRRRKLFNGRIECTYFQFLGPRPPRKQASEDGASRDKSKRDGATTATEPKTERRELDKPVFGGLEPKDREQADLFATRLKKRARHLRRWPTRRGITCYRLYERDVPELPFVVDRYGEYLHITEYDRPHERDPGRHAAWNELMVSSAAAALEVPIQKTYFKSRLRKPGNAQYTKVASDRKLIEVEESGLKFLINLSDYVDTGLFLDHRTTRSMVKEEAEGKRFLNLFAYTGSFSVYAAAGGAASTTTVDWSNTYIEWAGKNMAANGFTGAEHSYYAEDVVNFVNEAVAAEKVYDLAVVDPPTYSNSKRSENDWDVQAGHSPLLKSLAMCLSPPGVVYFSNNFRRFKLDESLGEVYSIHEISKQTVPEDFRNKRIHRCWRLEKN